MNLSPFVPVLGISILFSCASLAEEYPNFKVSEAKGDCQIKEIKGGAYQQVKTGVDYAAGAVGKTGADGKMKIEFNPQTRFRLFPESEVIINAAANNPRLQKIVDLRVKKGGAEVSLEGFPKDHKFKVQTPTAVCGAMGTVFTVEVDENQKNHFECKESSIVVKPRSYDEDEKSEKDTEFEAFTAKVPAGSFVDTTVKPGSENAYVQVKTGGKKDVNVAFGNDSNKSLEAMTGSEILIAQAQRQETGEVAIQVKGGQVGNYKAGKYLLDSENEKEPLLDCSKQKGVTEKFDDYLAAAKVEGALMAQVVDNRKKKIEDKKLEKDLSKAAEDASEKRKKLFEYRKEMRDTIRRGLEDARGAAQPPRIPR